MYELAPRVPPRGSGVVSWDCRRRRGTSERSSRKGMRMGPSRSAIDPLRAVLDLSGESEGVSIRLGTRPAVAGRVGSCSLDLTSIRGYGGYQGGGGGGSKSQSLRGLVVREGDVSASVPRAWIVFSRC